LKGYFDFAETGGCLDTGPVPLYFALRLRPVFGRSDDVVGSALIDER
jgi:hypothetical protein